MTTVDGYAMSSWERGYGDMLLRPGPRDAAAGALAGGDGDLPGRRRLAGRLGRASPRRARSCAASSRGWPSAAGRANAGTELEFMVFRDTYEQAWHKGYRDAAPGQPLQRRLLAARHRPRGAADPPHPQQHGRRGDGRRGLQGRVQLRPARDQLPLRRRAAHRRRARDLQERRQGDRRRSRACRSRSWPSTTSARATRATSTSRSPTSRARCSRATARCSSPSWPASSPCLREMTLLLAPNVNSYKRYAAAQLRADDGRLGPRQPHVLAARRRPRPVAALREPRRAAPT